MRLINLLKLYSIVLFFVLSLPKTWYNLVHPLLVDGRLVLAEREGKLLVNGACAGQGLHGVCPVLRTAVTVTNAPVEYDYK